MSTTSHAELIGHSTSQQAGSAVMDGGPNIIIMENSCGETSNKYIITSSSQHHQQQQQHIILGAGSTGKKSGKVSTQNRHNNKSSSLVVSNKGGSHQMIMTSGPNIVTQPSNHKEQRMYTVQQTKAPKGTMYTTQQVYTTNVLPQGSGQQQQIIQQQSQKVSSMPRNVQVVSKNVNNLILCRSPSLNNSQEPPQHSYIQQIHESNQQQQPAFATSNTNATTMKTIYVNNNTGGLNLNKSSNNNKILTPIDYSAVVEQKPQSTKYVTQKIVHSQGPDPIDASSSNASNNAKSGAGKSYNNSNNCTINVQQSQYYYQPATVYATDPNSSNKVSSSTTTKIISNAKNMQQQQPQYLQVQNHRMNSNTNYVTTTQTNPGPVQKHRTSTTSNKYIIQNVQSNAIPVSSVTQQQQHQQNLRQTQPPTVISYNSNNSTITSNNDQQPSVIQSPLKMRTVLHPIEATGIEDGARIYTVHHSSGEPHLVATNNTNNSNNVDEIDAPRGYVSSNTAYAAGNNSTTTSNENYMMVNGTKMTDEMSARILHDLSQRSSIKYNSNNNKQSNHSTGPSNVNNGTMETTQLVQLSQHPQNFYATRQPDGTVVWNGTGQTQTQQEQQFIRRTSESSNYITNSSSSSLPVEYQRQSSNSMSGDSHIIYQPAGIIVDRIGNPNNNNNSAQQHQLDQDEEVTGIEERPSPIPVTSDGKLSILHAVYQDHTYCTPMTPRLVSVSEQTFSTMNPNLDTNTVAAAAVLSSMPGAAKLFNRQNSGVVTSVPSVQQQQQLMVQQQQQQQLHQQRDDDANSTISTESHGGLYIDQGDDPGEETETALEGEGEEDSETRCICELTHDDGYMICCDSCSTWQHVDCMKIDRQNIPEEYQCVNCFPREVDALAARTLQLQKRKEQSALQLYPIASIYEGVQNSKMTPGKHDKKNNLSLKQKKKDLLSGKKSKKDLKDPKNIKRNDSTNRSNGKRKSEMKRMSKKKLKQLSGDLSTNSTPDKLTSTLRNWIDNYEVAMTNHYSPELRARLQSFGKQLNPGDNHLPPEPKIQWMDVDEPVCTTVPHAGAKILISTRNIDPNAAIIEIRGKYMLDTQQNKSNNAMLNATRKPSSGPFLFYHSVPRGSLDICVDTRTYGNEARFIRRSCRPNAEIQHKIEKNSVHLYIVARYKIMEGAEITISHDVNVDPLTRTNSMSHTSTLCACGLVRDCKFAAALAATPPLSSPPHSAPPLFTQNVIKRKNGVHNIGPDGVKEKRKYKKRKEKPPKEQKENRSRGRSTSSSAESHAGMLSPPLKNYEIHPDFLRSSQVSQQQQQHMIPPQQMQLLPIPNHISEQTMETVRSITPVMTQQQQQQHAHDQQIFYESAGLLKQQLDAPHQEPSIDMHFHATQQKLLQKSPLILNDAVIPTIVQTATIVKEIPVHLPEQVQPRAITPIQMPPMNVPIVVQQPQIQLQQQQQSVPILHSPVSQINAVPQQHVVSSPTNNVVVTTKPEVIPKSPPTTPQKPQKRASKSQRNSIHEAPIVQSTKEEAASTSASTVPNTPTKDESNVSTDKETTTSHEKKKLTREERKMEAIVKAFEKMEKTLQRKQEQKAHKITPKKQRNLNSSSNTAKNNLLHANKRRMMNQKRKKRKSKSHSSSSHANKKGDRHSGESSDAGSSCDENIMTKSSSNNALSYQNTFNNSSSSMSNADLLLSYSKLKNETETGLSGIPPLISPACMLVEAAVGDLEPTSNSSMENAFKFPHRTKTKKALMNEWLTQSDTNYVVKNEVDSDMKTKVEEGMLQNNMKFGDDEPLSLVKHEFENMKCVKNLTTPPQASSPQAIESSSFAGSESAVKKRWLRQAISEETNDEGSNSQQNEFTTPLKKRRVVIEQTEDASPSSSSNDVSCVPKMENDLSQESLSENIKEEDTQEEESNVVKKEEKENVTEMKVLESKDEVVRHEDTEEKDVKVDEVVEDKPTLKKEEVESIIDSIKVEEPENDKSYNADDMDHLHKVVASFHSESLMMLQTRNKKTSGTASLPDTPKKPLVNAEPDTEPSRQTPKSVSPDTTTQEPTSTTVSETPELKLNSITTSILAQTLSAAPTTPVAETIPFGSSRYLNNIQRSEVPSILATAPPVIEEYTPTSDYRTSFTYRPMMTNLTMNEYPESSIHTADPYIPSYNKATLIAATTPTGATLTGQFAPAFSTGYASSTSLSSEIPGVSGTTPSAFLGKSYSTLNDGPAPGHQSYYGQKIFTKTASHDPRLNPSLVTEEIKPAQPPQPKKKLSLTEYRKRKAQSTDSTSNDGCAENSTGVNNISTTGDDINSTKSEEDLPNKKKCTPSSSPLRNSLDENTTDDASTSEIVNTTTDNNNIDDQMDNVPSSSTSSSGNSSPTTTPKLLIDNDDELTEKLANKMTSNENITGNSPTQTDAHTSSSIKVNNDSAVTQDVDDCDEKKIN